MLSIQSNKAYAVNEYAEFADIWVPAIAKGQNILEVFQNTQSSSGTNILDYANWAFITLRGIPFAWYIHPYPDLVTNNRRFASLPGNSLARTISTSNTFTGTANKIRTNLLLNYKAWQGKKLAENIKVELMTYYTWGTSGTLVTSSTMVVLVKKVNTAWSVTTLKTITTLNLANEWSGSSNVYRNVEVLDNNAIATLNDGDIVYLDVEITYSCSTFNQPTVYWLANNGSVFTFLSVE